MSLSSSHKLLVSLTSPFARKCRIAITARGLDSQIAIHRINPWTSHDLRALNPLSKVPTLILPTGEALYDSRVIVEYLDALPSPSVSSSTNRRPLVPLSGTARWRALRLQALCDDACLAAGRLFAASTSPTQSVAKATSRGERLRQAVLFSLDALEKEQLDPASWDLGDMCAVLLPSYYSLRFPKEDWREMRPRLAKFVKQMEEKDEFVAHRFELPQES